MSSLHGPADQFLLHKSLACVLKLCVGKVTTIELRNEAFITGRIISVDGYMNVVLNDVSFVDPARNSQRFEHFFVQNRLIRFVQIPVEVDVKQELQRMFDQSSTGRGRGREFGVSRGRKKIEALRAQRKREDAQNAMKMKEDAKNAVKMRNEKRH